MRFSPPTSINKKSPAIKGLPGNESVTYYYLMSYILAERVGFEPTVEVLPLHSLSRRAPSADSAISPCSCFLITQVHGSIHPSGSERGPDTLRFIRLRTGSRLTSFAGIQLSLSSCFTFAKGDQKRRMRDSNPQARKGGGFQDRCNMS